MDSASNREKAYKDFVKFRQGTNPCVTGLSKFLEAPRHPQSSCQIYAMGYPGEGNQRSPADFEKVNPNYFPSVLTAPSPCQGRLIIIEDVHPFVVEILGSILDIDPIFFANHIVTKYDDISISPAPPSVSLAPSQIVSQEDWFHMHYQQIVDLGPAEMFRSCPWGLITSGNVPRAVRRLPAISGRQLGIVRSCCSVLIKSFDRSWIGEFLVQIYREDS